MKCSLDNKIQSELEKAVEVVGTERVLGVLSQLQMSAAEHQTLTIIVNDGVHYLSSEYHRGEVYIASRGTIDLSTVESIHREFTRILMATAQKLKSRQWRRVYIIPFGPTTLSMQIKLLVYRICGFESTDVMNLSDQSRVDISLDIRKIIVDSENMDTMVG